MEISIETNNLTDRILWLVDYCKANRLHGIRFDKDFIDYCNLPNSSYLSDIRSGKITSPSFGAVWNIIKTIGVQSEWLADGTGDPFPDQPINNIDQPDIKTLKELRGYLKKIQSTYRKLSDTNRAAIELIEKML